MTAFSPGSLSPRAVPARPCALPFGLRWDDLRPALPGLAAHPQAPPQASITFEKQGLHGGDNACLLTVSYSTASGPRSETLFVKCITDPAKAEAGQYAYLARHGVPTPRVLAAVRREAAEVIVLEFLPRIGVDFARAEELDALLRLIAHVNAAPASPALRPPSSGTDLAVFDQAVHAALAALVDAGAFALGRSTVEAYAVYQRAQAACAALPEAVNHGEFYFQQVGWAPRRPAPELVVFDLETLALLPRFTDLADVLYPLAAYSGRAEAELLGRYLEHWHRLTGERLAWEAALRELRCVRVMRACQALPWLVGATQAPSARQDVREALRMTAAALRQDLAHF